MGGAEPAPGRRGAGGATDEDPQRSILLAVTGHDADTADLYWQVRRLARTKRGFLEVTP